MPGRNYYYQYDTNPRKIKPEYNKRQVKKKIPVKKVPTKKVETTQKTIGVKKR